MHISQQIIRPADVSSCKSQLQILFLDSDVENIASSTFASFPVLSSVTFGPTVNYIGAQAFFRDDALRSVEFQMTTPCDMHSTAFQESFRFTSYTAVAGSGFYVDAGGVLYHNTELVKCPFDKTGTYAMQDDCTQILTTAFGYSALGTLVLSSKLEDVLFAGFVYAALTTIDASRSLLFDTQDNVLYKGPVAVWVARGFVGTVVLRNGTKGVDSHFGTTGSMAKVVFPAGLESSQTDPFNNCKRLTTVECLGSFPPRLGSGTFRGTPVDTVILPCGEADVPFTFPVQPQPAVKHACPASVPFTRLKKRTWKIILTFSVQNGALLV